MKDTRSIEEQVAALTEEQKDTIVKVDKVAGLVTSIAMIPAVIVMLINVFAILDISLPFEVADRLVITNFIIMGLCIALTIGVFVFVKVKYPYYSGKKCDYIRKSRKTK